jgi:hypothetical protein
LNTRSKRNLTAEPLSGESVPIASKRSAPGIAVASCALTGFSFDLVRTHLLGDLGPAGYTVLVGALTLAAVVVLSFCARVSIRGWTRAAWCEMIAS